MERSIRLRFTSVSDKAAETLAVTLEAHPDYRVLRRLNVAHEWPALAGPTVIAPLLVNDPAVERLAPLRSAKLLAAALVAKLAKALAPTLSRVIRAPAPSSTIVAALVVISAPMILRVLLPVACQVPPVSVPSA
jgi:hypothetical protein